MEENLVNNSGLSESDLKKKTTITVPVHTLLRIRSHLKWRESVGEKIIEILDFYETWKDKVTTSDNKEGE